MSEPFLALFTHSEVFLSLLEGIVLRPLLFDFPRSTMHTMQMLMLLLFTGSYTLLMALVGLFFGVKMPTLTWTNEIMPIKQGAPVMLTLFCGFGYMVLLFVGFMLLPGWILGFLRYMSCFVGANLLLSVLIYLWLRKKGVASFSAL